jgi:hypothetical protein
MRMTMLAAIAALGLGIAGSTTVLAAPLSGPGVGTAAGAADMTQHVWWHYHYHYHWWRGGNWCWRHPYRC